MRTFKVKIEFCGLTGIYYSEFEVKARNVQSAERKASLVIGNRDGRIVACNEVSNETFN